MSLSTQLLAFSCLVFVCSVLGQIDRFDVTVVGSFRHTQIGDVLACDFCDDCGGNCQWFDNFTCPSPANLTIHGADDNQQRWGTCDPVDDTCNCFLSSAVGFQGVTDVPMFSNLGDTNITRIGRISHYNNIINGQTPIQLRLTITLTAPQLAQPFYIAYSLLFIETSNNPGAAEGCDPAIQRTFVSCDDRFSFEKLFVATSFDFNNVKYTLEVVGFLNEGDLGQPIKEFVTQETQVTRADIFARIITFCLETQCNANEDFIPAPNCSCVCQLSEEICQTVFGSDWLLDPTSCNCICGRNGSECTGNLTLNTETCGCGCALTEAECEAINPSYGLSVAPACACDCKKQKFLDCYDENVFFRPSKDESCLCVCVISDDACEAVFGDGYTANSGSCTCNPPDNGLTDGEIAGIVIGSVLGALGLLCLVALLAGLLVWLIRSGKIPGIYGYRIQEADLSGAQNSPFYSDVWKSNTNAAAGDD